MRTNIMISNTREQITREIKFRAWDKRNKKMFEVRTLGISDGYAEAKETKYHHHFEDIELMQSTGLKDVTGKDVYEGDVVLTINSGAARKLVRWIISMSYVGFNTGVGKNADSIKIVVGNIYENPELLIKIDEV